MNASPETAKKKVELAPTGEPVKEAVKVNQTTEWVAGIVSVLQKVTNLDGAAKALIQARTLHESGESEEAAKLVKGVFKKLTTMGTSYPKDLDPLKVDQLVKSGKYAELAGALAKQVRQASRPSTNDAIKEVAINARGAVQKLQGHQELVDETREMAGRMRKTKPKEVADHEAKKEAANQILNSEGEAAAENLASMEGELFREVVAETEALLAEIDSSNIVRLRKEWDTKKEQLKGRGELLLPEMQEAVTELKEKLKEKYKTPEVLKKKLRGEQDSEDFRKGVSALTEKVRDGAKLKKFEKLIVMTEKVQKHMSKGLSFREACQLLEPGDYAAARTFLNSQIKLDPETARDNPWYDEDYVIVAEILAEAEGGKNLTLQLVENIDSSYGGRVRVDTGRVGGEHEGRVRVESPHRRGDGASMERELLMAMNGDRAMFGFEDDVSGLNASGVDYLREMAIVESEWERDFNNARSVTEQEHLVRTRRSGYKQEMQNLDFQTLFEEVPELASYLDMDYFSRTGMVKLRQEVLDNRDLLNGAQEIWLQQVLFEQRMIAYEGVFDRMGQSLRATRLNTLNEIMGISTSQKGLARFHAMVYSAIDKQQNSYVDEETIKTVTRLWADQGPDFRLDHLLKMYREKIYVIGADGERKEVPGGEIGVMDFVNKLKRLVEDPDERAALGIPDGKKARYGTVLLRHTQTDLRDADRELVFRSTLKGMGIELDRFTEAEQKFVVARYQTYLDFAVQYLNIHKELHHAVGNASFIDNNFELPQGLPEAWYKIDPVLFLKFFMRYGVGGNFKEAYLFGDPGVRDHITMAWKEYASHLLLFDKDNPLGQTEMGAETVLGLFFEGDTSETAIEGAVFIRDTFTKALFHWGSENHKDEVTKHNKIGKEGDIASALRRSDPEVIAKLKEARPSIRILRAIKWEGFAKMANDPRLSEKLLNADNSPAGLRSKWNAFVEGYGEHYFNLEAAAAKRGGDHPLKYGMQKMFDYYKLYLDWQSTPLNGQKINALLQIVADVNNGAMPAILEKMYWLLKYSSERLGKQALLGGSTRRMALNEYNLPTWDTSFGLYGEGDNEWPSPASEELVNDTLPGAAIQKDSILHSRGLGGFEDNMAFLNLLKDLRASGKISDKNYIKMHREWASGYLWEGKLGPLQNMWRIMTLESAFEYFGEYYLGISGHQLREILTENTSKSAEKFWKHLSG